MMTILRNYFRVEINILRELHTYFVYKHILNMCGLLLLFFDNFISVPNYYAIPTFLTFDT